MSLQPFTQGALIGALGQPNQLDEVPKAKPGMIGDIKAIEAKPEVSRFRESMPSILARRF